MAPKDTRFLLILHGITTIGLTLVVGLIVNTMMSHNRALTAEIVAIRTEVSPAVVTVAVQGITCEAMEEGGYKFTFHEQCWDRYIRSIELHTPNGNTGYPDLENSAGMREFVLSESGTKGTLVVRLNYPESGELRFTLDRSSRYPTDWHWRLKKLF